MQRFLSFVLLAGGITLIAFGIAASDSFASDVSRFFTGGPTDKTFWLIAAGAATATLGIFGLRAGSKS